MWIGVVAGLAICICIGAGLIGCFYALGVDKFSATEDVWEGAFGIVASVIITIMGAALLRVNKLQDSWRHKLTVAMGDRMADTENVSQGGRFKTWAKKYAMVILPFVTVLREGLEAVVFIGGVGLGLPATAFPLAVVCGLGAGILIGVILYK